MKNHPTPTPGNGLPIWASSNGRTWLDDDANIARPQGLEACRRLIAARDAYCAAVKALAAHDDDAAVDLENLIADTIAEADRLMLAARNGEPFVRLPYPSELAYERDLTPKEAQRAVAFVCQSDGVPASVVMEMAQPGPLLGPWCEFHAPKLRTFRSSTGAAQ